MNIQELSAAAAGSIFLKNSSIYNDNEFTFVCRGCAWAVPWYDYFGTFWKSLRSIHGYPKTSSAQKPLKKPISYRSFCPDMNICCLIDRFRNVYTLITIFLQSGTVSLQDTWIKFLGYDFITGFQWPSMWFWMEQFVIMQRKRLQYKHRILGQSVNGF